jgi:hypothetical protein
MRFKNILTQQGDLPMQNSAGKFLSLFLTIISISFPLLAWLKIEAVLAARLALTLLPKQRLMATRSHWVQQAPWLLRPLLIKACLRSSEQRNFCNCCNP